MTNKFTKVLALGTLAVAMSAVFPAGAAPRGTSYGVTAAPKEACSPEQQAKGHHLTFTAPEKLWPPNHKYNKDVSVDAWDTTPSHKVDLTSTGTHNQYEGDTQSSEQNGSGNTADDIRLADGEDAQVKSEVGAAKFAANELGNPTEINWWVRAERSGHKSTAINEGREYSIFAKAIFIDADGDGDGSCEATWKIIVPHDMSPKNR